jgi:hypothetical protein
MTRRLLVPVVLLAALGAATLGANAATPTTECNAIRDCQRVVGPWVVVPAHGVAEYLLDCPRRRGIVAGVDALASSSDITVTFVAQMGGPIVPGRTTSRYALFRAVSTSHHRGLFQPRGGCIPINPSKPSTISSDISPSSPLLAAPQRTTMSVNALPGPPLQLAATNLKLRPGVIRTTAVGCAGGSKLVHSWTATAFRTQSMPPVALADAVRVTHTVQGKKVSVTIATSEALPPSSNAEVQLGVACSLS